MENRTRNNARIVTLPDALRAARLRLYLTPEQAAEKSGVSVGTIKAAEGSERSVHLSTIKALADAYGCDPSAISRVENGAAEATA